MKHTSVVRQCLFNAPQWHWYATEGRILYPRIYNVVKVDHERLGAYSINVAVPSELYMIMKQQGIKEIFGFRLDSRMLIAETDQGDLKLWVYSSIPKFLIHN